MDLKEKPELDEALLEHFGVRGMKWGVHKSDSGHGGGSSTQRIKDQRKADKLKERYARDDAIDAARQRVNSGELHRDAKAAKAEYKAQKKVVGRREARKVLREKRRVLNNEYATSQQLKSGREKTTYILAAGGLAVLGGVAKGVATYNS